MSNFEQLWEYQKKDIELENLRAEIKNTPTRKRLVQLQRYLKSSQKKIGDFENQAILNQNALHEFERQYLKAVEDLDELDNDIGYYSEANPKDVKKDEVQQLSKSGDQLASTVSAIRRELQRIKRETESADKSVRELLIKMRAAKKEYDTLYQTHQKELEESSGKTDALERAVADAEKGIEKNFLDEYKRIKGFRSNPVVTLEDSRCTGCNMQLPASVGSSVVSEEKPIMCENCGRILIVL